MGLLDNIFKRRNAIAATMVNSRGELRPVEEILSTFTTEQMRAHTTELERMYNTIYKGKDIKLEETIAVDYRIKSVTEWLSAIRAADVRRDYDVPSKHYLQSNWIALFDIFENMKCDPHVSAALLTLEEGVRSKSFEITDKSGAKLNDATIGFNSEWFHKAIEIFLNAHFYGFSLLQIQEVDSTTGKAKIKEVNRRHVRPDLHGVVVAEYGNKLAASWENPKFARSTVFSFLNNLGALNSAVRWWIYKTEVARYWAIYNQLYANPALVGKTDITDTTRKANMINALENYVNLRYVSLGLDDTIEPIATATTATATFEAQIRLCDEQISKGIVASTMVLDNGSSRAQGETHAENTDKVITSLARYVMFRVNDELLPKLRGLGMVLPEGARFRWIEDEVLTMGEKADIVVKLAPFYHISAEVVSDFVGITVADKPAQTMLAPVAQKALENYKKEVENGKK
ncbi:MAG: DUF935 family protein [Rikenellaceae bacterium]